MLNETETSAVAETAAAPAPAKKPAATKKPAAKKPAAKKAPAKKADAAPEAVKTHPKPSAAAERKEKKMTLATEIYQKHLPKKDTMTKREFRALVVEDFKKKLDIENSGTLGMYYSIVDARVTGRKFKKYNRVSERKPNRTAEQRAQDKMDRLTTRERRRAEKDAMKALRQAKKTHNAAAAPDAALATLANEALEKINKIAAVGRHQAEVLHANSVRAAAKKTTAKKA